MNTLKNMIHYCDQRTKNLEHPCKHCYPEEFDGSLVWKIVQID